MTRDKPRCPACGQIFDSNAAFDAHRVGKFGRAPDQGGRRCRTIPEMMQRGMAKNEAGHWIAKPAQPKAAPDS